MATKAEVLGKVLKIVREEHPYDEYVLFLELIIPKAGDSAKEIRELRDKLTDDDILRILKEKRVLITE
jgi:hypothetical protein